VLKVAEEMKYYPNVHARALAGGNDRTLGIIVSNLENPFFLDIFGSLQSAALAAGHEVLIANTDYDPERLKANVRLMIGRRLGGLALVVSEMDAGLLDELSERSVTTVVYDVGRARRNIVNIKVNYRGGMQKIAAYLYGLGHRRLAFIGHHSALGPLNDRRQTFVEVMEHYEPRVQYELGADTDSFQGGSQAVQAMFASGFRPTAVVCVNDVMAVGVMHGLRKLGLNVPGDVSVTGFDNISLAEMMSPALTTMNIPRDEIGRMMFEHLTREERPPEGLEIVVEPELVKRESTGPVVAG
jgi:DNA-binding LacI/PurR family transcriptional regulator